MNHYGLLIRDRWLALAPTSYREIPNREDFFSELGETMTTTVIRLTDQLAATTPSNQGYLNRVGTLNSARKAAEEVALDEVPWPQVEMTSDEAREEWEATRDQESGLADWMSSQDRPLLENELEELSENWFLSMTFLREMSESTSPMDYLDSHPSEVQTSQQLRYTRYLQNH